MNILLKIQQVYHFLKFIFPGCFSDIGFIMAWVVVIRALSCSAQTLAVLPLRQPGSQGMAA
jgi:hypothetical protein